MGNWKNQKQKPSENQKSVRNGPIKIYHRFLYEGIECSGGSGEVCDSFSWDVLGLLMSIKQFNIAEKILLLIFLVILEIIQNGHVQVSIEKSKQLHAKILTERKYLAESFLLFGTQLIPNHSVLRSNVPIKRIGHV